MSSSTEGAVKKDGTRPRLEDFYRRL